MGVVVVVLVGSVVASLAGLVATRAWARREPPVARGGAVRSAYELAFLEGGPETVADAVVRVMREKERVRLAGDWLRVLHPVADDDLERELLAQFGTDWTASLEDVLAGLAASDPVWAVSDELAERGLLLDLMRYEAWRLAGRVHDVVCLVAALGMAGALLVADLAWFVAVPGTFAGAVALLLVGRSLGGSRLTPAGRDAVVRARRKKRFRVVRQPERRRGHRLRTGSGYGSTYSAGACGTAFHAGDIGGGGGSSCGGGGGGGCGGGS
ncbi:TIGR04222 domain-containing membrane protein [Streptomyces sp. 8K308]|uniref:TIGR04222 domain-containing membrane protein n=1 Tax=Streptomyces sp. 8K308 TaxID=2530388 RepID=UPI0010429FDA|nr:TIGR04222 domain-containing membrane protein [Streptomyces sp. 8K308]